MVERDKEIRVEEKKGLRKANERMRYLNAQRNIERDTPKR